MGEAKRRKAEAAAVAAATREQLANIDAASLASAVQQVVLACTDIHGADCLLYATIGAGVLRTLGIDANPVAGSAVWRVGPGDTDTISHASELQGALYAHAGAVQAGMFHAWIEAPGLEADFSTNTLKLKAEQLDAMDGGTTTVVWAPSYFWMTADSPARGRMKSPMQVLKAMDPGVFAYVRHAVIEKVVLPQMSEIMKDMSSAIHTARQVYEMRLVGHGVRVVGLGGDDGPQETPKINPLQRIG